MNPGDIVLKMNHGLQIISEAQMPRLNLECDGFSVQEEEQSLFQGISCSFSEILEKFFQNRISSA